MAGAHLRQIVQEIRWLSSTRLSLLRHSSADYATAKCKGSRQITVVDTPYMQYDIALQIETPYLYCPHCAKYAVVRPQCIHPKRCMTLRLMGHVARLMQETSARLLSGILRLSQSSILRADKDILTLIDEARPICLDGRRALIIDEKYLGRDKKFVTCVIDGCSGGSASFFL